MLNAKPVSGSSFLMINKKLAIEIGIFSAFLLPKLVDDYEIVASKNLIIPFEDKLFFPVLCEDIERELNLSYRQQKAAIKGLIKFNLIETKILGCPPKLHFHINEKEVFKFLMGK